jgi:hypothetical protein
VFQNQFFLERFDAMFLVVATEWISSFKSSGFLEPGWSLHSVGRTLRHRM